MAQKNKATQLWKLLKDNLVQATALARRYASGRFQKIDLMPYCMYEVHYISESESEAEEEVAIVVGKGKSLKKKVTPDVEMMEIDEPMEEVAEVQKPQWDSYAVPSARMAVQIEQITADLQRLPPAPEDQAHRNYVQLQELRPYEIINPTNAELIEQIMIPVFITDENMDQIIGNLEWEGYFAFPSNYDEFDTGREIRARVEELEQDLKEEERQREEEGRQRKMREEEEREIFLYNNRIRQPDTLLSLSARIGSTHVNEIINKDDDQELEIYLDTLLRAGYYP